MFLLSNGIALLDNSLSKSLICKGFKMVVADREGFEPSIEFPLYTRSRRAPSTTRPPVHFHDRWAITPLVVAAEAWLILQRGPLGKR